MTRVTLHQRYDAQEAVAVYLETLFTVVYRGPLRTSNLRVAKAVYLYAFTRLVTHAWARQDRFGRNPAGLESFKPALPGIEMWCAAAVHGANQTPLRYCVV
ncbi:hypothetical protein HYFRA_00003439 [Hymenoscyphus fraxineus]|uniref:Uncharacterized protein n=1 Tax=Hymenoscyphus fraxineus TaxID=746836 RepID=A0A9N9KUC6_9HELO|nr:hypothetical protein HYFRA_00003439 [Hymenoscyphus fraxineus]